MVSVDMYPSVLTATNWTLLWRFHAFCLPKMNYESLDNHATYNLDYFVVKTYTSLPTKAFQIILWGLRTTL